ncbi:MAG: Asp/Glu racemase, partial [Pseudomonadota bacterium]
RLALLSPYVKEVSDTLRERLAEAGLSTEVFGSFGEPEEAKVARIAPRSTVDAACALGQQPGVDAVFLSCTNLPTRVAIPEIETRLGKPVFSSNSALAWHLKALSA